MLESSISPFIPAPSDMSSLPSRDETPRHSKVVQRLFERPSSAMEPAHHRSDRHVRDVRYLFVGETFHIGEENRHAEVLRKRLQGGFDLVICDPRKSLPRLPRRRV